LENVVIQPSDFYFYTLVTDPTMALKNESRLYLGRKWKMAVKKINKMKWLSPF